MKKTYSKPALYAESFELAEHIALCSGFTGVRPANNHWDKYNCAFMTETGFTLFTGTTTGGCALIEDPNQSVSVRCYNSPLDGNGQPFSS